MIVVHIESGLGNQMLDYCEYLALAEANPGQKCYIENLIYEIPECDERICQWNGYELDRIFGINPPNIKELFTDNEWKAILENVRDSKFWDKQWNWPVYIQKAFEAQGLVLENIRGDFEQYNPYVWSIADREHVPLKIILKNTGVYQNLRRIYKSRYPDKYVDSDVKMLYYQTNGDILTGHRETFHLVNNDIERIDGKIRETFVFPELTDDVNKKYLEMIQSTASVGIHVRRGDYLVVNAKYYNSGYFKRAVRYIKKHVDAPFFFFFCDPGSKEWCYKNQKQFDLDFNKDNVKFVDCNTGMDSYKDMQLMSCCKHTIVTNSSFGWWAAYLNTNPDKITISPEIEYNTTVHC